MCIVSSWRYNNFINRSLNPVAWSLLHLSQPHIFPSAPVLPSPGPDPLGSLSRLLSRRLCLLTLPGLTHRAHNPVRWITLKCCVFFNQATVILKFLQQVPWPMELGCSQFDFNNLCKFKFVRRVCSSHAGLCMYFLNKPYSVWSYAYAFLSSRSRMPLPGSLSLSRLHPSFKTQL